MTACEPGCERTVPHDPPGECWTSGLGIVRPDAFVRASFAEDLEPVLPPGAPTFAAVRAITDDDGWQRNTITLPISLELALDYNLLEPGSPQYLEAVERQRQHTERLNAWRRSWPGRRARGRAAVRTASHAVRHRLARLLDPECIGYEDPDSL